MKVMRSQVGNDTRQGMRSQAIVRMRVRSQVSKYYCTDGI